MRIIGGRLKGTRLRAPDGLLVRPTRDAVREAFFDILGDWVDGKSVLDLYAGSGSLGIEALSRGADSAVFVENHPESIACLNENLRRAGLESAGRIVREDVLAFLDGTASGRARAGFHGVFADPPFAFSAGVGLADLVAGMASDRLWGEGECVAMIEVEAANARIEDLAKLPGETTFRKYGRNLLCIARCSRSGPAPAPG